MINVFFSSVISALGSTMATSDDDAHGTPNASRYSATCTPPPVENGVVGVLQDDTPPTSPVPTFVDENKQDLNTTATATVETSSPSSQSSGRVSPPSSPRQEEDAAQVSSCDVVMRDSVDGVDVSSIDASKNEEAGSSVDCDDRRRRHWICHDPFTPRDVASTPQPSVSAARSPQPEEENADEVSSREDVMCDAIAPEPASASPIDKNEDEEASSHVGFVPPTPEPPATPPHSPPRQRIFVPPFHRELHGHVFTNREVVETEASWRAARDPSSRRHTPLTPGGQRLRDDNAVLLPLHRILNEKSVEEGVILDVLQRWTNCDCEALSFLAMDATFAYLLRPRYTVKRELSAQDAVAHTSFTRPSSLPRCGVVKLFAYETSTEQRDANDPLRELQHFFVTGDATKLRGAVFLKQPITERTYDSVSNIATELIIASEKAPPSQLPSSVKSVSFVLARPNDAAAKLDVLLETNWLPSSLERLYLEYVDGIFVGSRIPQTVVSLRFGLGSAVSLQATSLHAGLRELSLPRYLATHLAPGVLPHGLERLSIENDTSLEPGVLPSTLRWIRFGGYRNAIVAPGSIPDGVTDVVVGSTWCMILVCGSLPPSVRYIKAEGVHHSWPPAGVLPGTVHVLEADFVCCPPPARSMPRGLEELRLSCPAELAARTKTMNAFVISAETLPPTLITLDMRRLSVPVLKVSTNVRLPPLLRTLHVPSDTIKFSMRLDIWPTRVNRAVGSSPLRTLSLPIGVLAGSRKNGLPLDLKTLRIYSANGDAGSCSHKKGSCGTFLSSRVDFVQWDSIMPASVELLIFEDKNVYGLTHGFMPPTLRGVEVAGAWFSPKDKCFEKWVPVEMDDTSDEEPTPQPQQKRRRGQPM
jgi:hypothetical protein